ncbi:hypothetical protein AA313_de0204065 [Arthrobotrys entomopaga]|nr:hypothetical protein AA313_de0204065 [Arthrobotrys entomopaga]
MATLAVVEKTAGKLVTGLNQFKAQTFQRIMFFHAANETGGTAMLYHILLKTPHPLFIYYLSRYRAEGHSACTTLKKDPQFLSALKSSGSQMVHSHTWSGVLKPSDLQLAAESFVKRYRLSHGPRPISYIFVNGHPAFGNPLHGEESSAERESRLLKFWSPSAGALDKIAPYNSKNKFDRGDPCESGVRYVSQVTKFLAIVLPLVRDDGEGTVVVKTPAAGLLPWIKSKELREGFANPTPRFYEDTVLAYRRDSKQSLRRSPWPRRYLYPAIADIFIKSAIILYKSFSQFEKIIFHRCVYHPQVYLPDIDLLIGKERASIPTALFSEEELESTSRSFNNDIDYGIAPKAATRDRPQAPSGIARRVSNPTAHVRVHNMDPNAKKNFSVEEFRKKYPEPMNPETPLIRPIYARCTDDNVVTSHFTPIWVPPTTKNDTLDPPKRKKT